MKQAIHHRTSALILLAAGLASGCAGTIGPVASEDMIRYCRPGHAVRFAAPEGAPIPKDAYAPDQGSCMR